MEKIYYNPYHTQPTSSGKIENNNHAGGWEFVEDKDSQRLSSSSSSFAL